MAEKTLEGLMKLKLITLNMMKRNAEITLKHEADTNTTSLITKMRVFRNRKRPEPQLRKILPNGQTRELCNTDEERLNAMKDWHERWMDKSKANKQCLFVDLKYDDTGMCGVDLHPEQQMNDNWGSQLIPGWNTLPKYIQNSVRTAHRKEIASIFRIGEVL